MLQNTSRIQLDALSVMSLMHWRGLGFCVFSTSNPLAKVTQLRLFMSQPASDLGTD